jgi:hypothetical protein
MAFVRGVRWNKVATGRPGSGKDLQNRRHPVPDADDEDVDDVKAKQQDGLDLGVDVNVILTPPCIFCTANH